MIRAEKLNKTYDRRSRNANHVLKDVSFTLPDTGFVCILGPSGCGKTSLLNALGGLDKFDNGTLTAGEVSVSRYGTRAYEAERNRNFGYIFQNYYLLAEHSVAYNIYLGLHSLKLSHAEKLKRVRQALEAVDMGRYIRRKVGELSGGQQQRVAIARALARRPRVIFADEPTGNLDEANTMNICTLLRQISRESLVIMVTHEERIASFFADRIIRLDGGIVAQDSEGWDRSQLRLGNEKDIYAGDYEETIHTADNVTLRVLREEGAAPAEVTVAVLKNRIVIRLTDGRTVSCGGDREVPILHEGKRPEMTLETVENSSPRFMTGQAAPQTRAGHGIRLGMMLQEAKHLLHSGGAKRIGMRLFLILLTVLTMWTACDYITVSSVNPEDFIKTDSHILEITMKRGPDAADAFFLDEYYAAYQEFCLAAPTDFLFLPSFDAAVTFAVELFPQMQNASIQLPAFSRVPLSSLDSATLVAGRMPQVTGEVVLDRWVLDKMLAEESVVKNAMSDASYFLNERLYFALSSYHVTVVGICDSGEPSMYMTVSDMIRTSSVRGTVMLLSDFKAAHPGEYDDLVLSEGECLVNTAAAGASYAGLVGHEVELKRNFKWVIQATVFTEDPASFIINDAEAQRYMRSMSTNRFLLYCQDKAAMKAYLTENLPETLEGKLIIDVKDQHSDATAAYMEASQLKVNARTIVTVTVLLLSAVMLYLLCRSQARERIGMLAVYRLLGIPGRKLRGIFLLEALLASLQTALPVAVLSWAVFRVLDAVPELSIQMIMPWYAGLAVYGGILLYHLLVAVLPLGKLLRLPPAQLAAKYDY